MGPRISTRRVFVSDGGGTAGAVRSVQGWPVSCGVESLRKKRGLCPRRMRDSPGVVFAKMKGRAGCRGRLKGAGPRDRSGRDTGGTGRWRRTAAFSRM